VGFIHSEEDTFVTEGFQVLHLKTKAFTGDLLVHSNEHCGGGAGGISLVDVTDPLRPKKLRASVGDFSEEAGTTTTVAHMAHSAFAWQAGDRAFAVLGDEEEPLDVDIMEITDPPRPELVKETALRDWPQARQSTRAVSFFHDVVGRQVDGRWVMLLSYWDAGWVLLDVTEPSAPVSVGDSDYLEPDALTGLGVAEGNAHQAWFDSTGRFVIGADDDSAPYRAKFRIVTGPAAGEYPGGEFGYIRGAVGEDRAYRRTDGLRRLRL
jgi:hypothetical protein